VKTSFVFGDVEVDILFQNRHVGQLLVLKLRLSFLLCSDEGKVEVFILVDPVHLIAHEGHGMPTWMRYVFL
jgi:hypothetical protein